MSLEKEARFWQGPVLLLSFRKTRQAYRYFSALHFICLNPPSEAVTNLLNQTKAKLVQGSQVTYNILKKKKK